MPFHFCSQCGTKLQPGFKFCPSCGGKLPSSDDEPELVGSAASVASSLLSRNEAATTDVKTSPASSPARMKVSARPALRKTRNSVRLNKVVEFSVTEGAPAVLLSTSPARRVQSAGSSDVLQASPPKLPRLTPQPKVEPPLPSDRSTVGKSPRSARQRSNQCSPAVKQEGEASTVEGSTSVAFSLSPASGSPLKGAGKSKAKKAKHSLALQPLPDGEEVTDTTGRKWTLIKLLSQSTAELIYEVSQLKSKESNHILKLGAKDGRIFNEQNFLQRAAKPSSVEKWIKQNKMDFLGIPSCVGFGLHADSYRFLIFPSMGCSLLSIIEEKRELLSEEVVLQLACRILDALQYLHSNEYVHADISAENIYIKPGQESQVYLLGYCHAFRYAPGGKHVEYREASRTPHEGTVEYISVDAHAGAAPSRRSDLESLGYCMLHWHTGTLPWAMLTDPKQVASQKKRYMQDVTALLTHCFGKKKVSNAFRNYLVSVMSLQYLEEPKYSLLKAGLISALEKFGMSPKQPLSF
ncbi:serine/threonine-protein kinase VRK3 [Gouania willdenowi]|uniref:Protein kinase domain-containing protein n=1 Tax=Gouania willdenowi TaxID=441366 RepID=A0A8C5NGV6_GOUWI|nr:inactive serine/threonine-protein kinase VRK3 [Gouania willdenowi]